MDVDHKVIMKFYIQNNGFPMSAEEKRKKYPDGRCPLCLFNHGWIGGASADEGEIMYYYIQCMNCETSFPEEE